MSTLLHVKIQGLDDLGKTSEPLINAETNEIMLSDDVTVTILEKATENEQTGIGIFIKNKKHSYSKYFGVWLTAKQLEGLFGAFVGAQLKWGVPVANINESIQTAVLSSVTNDTALIELQAEFDQYKRESVKWGAEDVLERAKKLKVKITKDEAQEILEMIIHKHDASIGISWDSIDTWILYHEQEKDSKP